MADRQPQQAERTTPVARPELFRARAEAGDGVMTLGLTVGATLLLLSLTAASAGFVWWQIAQNPAGTNLGTLLLGGVIGGLIFALLTSFVPRLAPWTGPLYAVTEGVALGAISSLYNARYAGLPMQAVVLSLAVALGVLALYATRVIQVTDRMKGIIYSMTLGLMLFYLVSFVLGFFGVQVPGLFGNGIVGIGFSLLVTGLAAANLLLDYRMIEDGVANRAPRYMAWYGAFATTVTLVWLYLEMLRLLGTLRRRLARPPVRQQGRMQRRRVTRVSRRRFAFA
jgi:uncharacterized YccA/Bax inhibitor family protein